MFSQGQIQLSSSRSKQHNKEKLNQQSRVPASFLYVNCLLAQNFSEPCILALDSVFCLACTSILQKRSYHVREHLATEGLDTRESLPRLSNKHTRRQGNVQSVTLLAQKNTHTNNQRWKCSEFLRERTQIRDDHQEHGKSSEEMTGIK